jgi:hypothetical protein
MIMTSLAIGIGHCMRACIYALWLGGYMDDGIKIPLIYIEQTKVQQSCRYLHKIYHTPKEIHMSTTWCPRSTSHMFVV